MALNTDIVLFALAFALWSAVHSLTASLGFKALSRSLVGERLHRAFYRLIYNLFSLLTFAPVLLLAAVLLSDTLLWSVGPPFSGVFLAIQLLGGIGLAISLWQTGLWRFVGLRQAVDYFRGPKAAKDEPELETGGMYRLVRHPLYFFSLVLLWFNPVMTWQTFTFNVAASLYFWLGSILEERKLEARFGETYRDYRRRVPRLLPFVGWL
ncbi:MAG: isoprenylcysteine carboxylmethyltransferase family protein [Candidatus Promineifilaceae bacterium]|nr:isoprenylcysteine carboxylmethyltransferase family protein [Candidatus Promineifilaceae bacterium]